MLSSAKINDTESSMVSKKLLIAILVYLLDLVDKLVIFEFIILFVFAYVRVDIVNEGIATNNTQNITNLNLRDFLSTFIIFAT